MSFGYEREIEEALVTRRYTEIEEVML